MSTHKQQDIYFPAVGYGHRTDSCGFSYMEIAQLTSPAGHERDYRRVLRTKMRSEHINDYRSLQWCGLNWEIGRAELRRPEQPLTS